MEEQARRVSMQTAGIGAVLHPTPTAVGLACAVLHDGDAAPAHPLRCLEVPVGGHEHRVVRAGLARSDELAPSPRRQGVAHRGEMLAVVRRACQEVDHLAGNRVDREGVRVARRRENAAREDDVPTGDVRTIGFEPTRRILGPHEAAGRPAT